MQFSLFFHAKIQYRTFFNARWILNPWGGRGTENCCFMNINHLGLVQVSS